VSTSIDPDEFTNIMSQFLEVSEKQLAIIVADAANVLETHKTICDFYGVDPKDEMRDKSENFFKLFAEFFKLCEKSLPAIEKKKLPKK
jgi:spermidine synthase